MPTLNDYKGQVPAWCPGCGNYGILKAFKEAFVEMEIEPHQFLIVSGIGQAGKFPHYLRCNTFNGLHGRTLPVATGAKLANHEMLVVAVGGDGDCYGEGGNHLVHAMRRNIGVKLFVHDNQIYGLTKGQASPTSAEGMVTKNQPFGVLSEQFSPMAMAVALDCSFAARGYAGDQEHLKGLIKEAVRHKGFSLVDILQPCVTFNKINTYAWYGQRVYRIEPDYDPEDRAAAFEKALEWGEKIPIGLIYRKHRPTFEERVPVIDGSPLVNRSIFSDAMRERLRATMEKYW
ncbi:2-oxoacid:ferredoxin oxidoreductase subunit beta [Syntrophorhabdus aromaticivorans]|jgi:2-oxoglutarate ferredoxin oxidoreductase subunit beta|uniref:2-oxoacid:ferredoxin oxidoreductase subunit beta n=1 Tax=Syntrophorhabdus aromaticivorans TaxID=328301 RepID=A0A971S0E3_9BACT|nr:2-oxoacid:ferredoxin oxidoreductase subunit beta [Syntrophorhabdus aromaticivorans]NLW35255.1 2-oxoacid:ferredoxin oxidoreductase subunit beta [Syntrophorhabdus aromaticivorans]